MKKISLLVLFATIATTVSAQFLLGGQFNISSVKDKSKGGSNDTEQTATIVMLMPRLAKVSGNMWYGIDAGLTLASNKYGYGNSSSKSSTTIFNVAPFLRYIKRPVENIGIWIEGQAGHSFGSSKNDDGEKTAQYTGFNVGVQPGVVFYIGNHLSFEASFGRLGYITASIADPDNSSDKTTTSQVGLILNNNALMLEETIAGLSNSFQFGVNWLF